MGKRFDCEERIMGIYIKGIEMPTSCYKCPLRRRDGMDIVCPVVHERFSVADVNILEYRLNNCPFVSVPPHGRLVDADRLMQEMHLFIKENMLSRDDARELLETIEDAPTVLEAEEGET